LYCSPTELKICPFYLLTRVSIHGWLYNKQREPPMITKWCITLSAPDPCGFHYCESEIEIDPKIKY
jgi:hypothetical protein